MFVPGSVISMHKPVIMSLGILVRYTFPLLLITAWNGKAQSITCNGGHCVCPAAALISGVPCIMNCMEDGICNESMFTCRPHDVCEINCSAKETCSDIIINAANATDVTVLCSSQASCTNHITTICGTGDCTLQCDGSDSCLNVAYSSTAAPPRSQCEHPSILSSIVPTNQVGIIVMVAIIVCCALIAMCTVSNGLFHRRIKRKQKSLERERVQSQSRRSVSVVSPSFNTRTSRVSVSGVPHQYQPRTRTSSVYTANSKQAATPLPCTPCDTAPGDSSPFPDADFATLPLSMKIPEFEIRVSFDQSKYPEHPNDTKTDCDEDDAGSSSESARL